MNLDASRYIAGLHKGTADKIVAHREAHGPFKTRASLNKVRDSLSLNLVLEHEFISSTTSPIIIIHAPCACTCVVTKKVEK